MGQLGGLRPKPSSPRRPEPRKVSCIKYIAPGLTNDTPKIVLFLLICGTFLDFASVEVFLLVILGVSADSAIASVVAVHCEKNTSFLLQSYSAFKGEHSPLTVACLSSYVFFISYMTTVHRFF